MVKRMVNDVLFVNVDKYSWEKEVISFKDLKLIIVFIGCFNCRDF